MIEGETPKARPSGGRIADGGSTPSRGTGIAIGESVDRLAGPINGGPRRARDGRVASGFFAKRSRRLRRPSYRTEVFDGHPESHVSPPPGGPYFEALAAPGRGRVADRRGPAPLLACRVGGGCEMFATGPDGTRRGDSLGDLLGRPDRIPGPGGPRRFHAALGVGRPEPGLIRVFVLDTRQELADVGGGDDPIRRVVRGCARKWALPRIRDVFCRFAFRRQTGHSGKRRSRRR